MVQLYVPPYLNREEEEEVSNEITSSPQIEEAPQRAVEAPSISETPTPVEIQEGSTEPVQEVPALITPPAPRLYVPDYIPAPPVEEETSQGLTRQDILSDPTKITPLREYMINRKGNVWVDKTDEEVLNGYISHMRWVGTNEVSLVGEWLHLQRGEETDKALAGEAYKIYDQMAPFWDNGNFWEGLGAVGEYAASGLLSPSTLLSLGVGKIVGQAVVKGSARQLLQTAMRTGGPEAVEVVAKSYSRRRAFIEAGAATATDSASNTAFDMVYQRDLMMATGAQEEFSWLQLGMAAASGALAGGMSYFPQASRGSAGVTAQGVRRSREEAAAAAMGKAAPRIKGQFEKLVQALNKEDWQRSVERGGQFDLRQSEVDKFVHTFFDVKNPDSITSILKDSGANLAFEEGQFTREFLNYLKEMPKKELDELNEVFEPNLGVTFGEAMDILANSMSRSGSIQGEASQASRALRQYYKLAGAKARANNTIAEQAAKMSEEKAKEEGPKVIRYVQSLWRRALVSHLSTTAVNIQGWGAAYSARALSETLHASGALVRGSLEAMVTGNLSNPSLARSSALFKNQIFKMKTLLDPYSTIESFEALLEKAPKNYKEVLMREHFGGIGGKDNLEIYNIPKNRATKGLEKTAKVAADISLVTFQDVWTKTLSGITSLDKQTRTKLGKSLSQLMKENKLNLIDDEMWGAAVKDALIDTFSYDYSRDRSSIKYMARLTDAASNAPILGFVFPFGKFMTNSLAFSTAYSPVAMLKIAGLFGRKATGRAVEEGEIGEAISKAIVGTVGLAMLGKSSYDAMGEGYQWNEIENSTGEIVDVQNIAPISGHILAGRMYHLAMNGEYISPELWTELGKQLIFGQYAEALKTPTAITELVNALPQAGDEENRFMSTLIREASSILFNIGSGFTRPLEPLNMAADMATQSRVQIDRRIPNTVYDTAMSEITRYTDALFYPLLGSPDEDGPLTPARTATRPEGDIRDPNPAARLVGVRRAQPKNDIDRVLGMINYPAFRLDERSGVPEWDRFVNQEIAPRLNRRAGQLLESEWFMNLPKDRQIDEVKKVVSDIRREVADLMTKGLYSDYDAILLNERSKFSQLSVSLRRDAKRVFGLQDVDDRELSLHQIRTLREWMKIREEESDMFMGR